jgi:hypothetical protein
MTTNIVDRVGFGLIVDGTQTNDGSAVLGLTPVKVTLPDVSLNGGLAGFIRAKVTNPNATAVLAWKAVPRGATAPTFDATFAASAGSHVLPGANEYVIMQQGVDLYIVASAITSSWAVASDFIR